MRSLLILLLAASPVLADFPEIYNSERDTTAQPMPPQEAAASFQMPEGFEVEVVFAEPDVQNPIAMNWDENGRLWVCETVDYPNELQTESAVGRDRIT